MAPAAKRNLNFTADIVDLIRVAAADGVAGAANGVGALAAAFAKSVGNPDDLARAHQNVGERMQDAVLNAYDARDLNGEQERDSPKRFKGKLRPALADPRQINATGKGIQFVNRSIMASRARHFARLNWGAAGSGFSGGSSPRTPLTLFGDTIASISFNEETRPAFSLPAGLFLGPNGRYTLPSGSRRDGMFVTLGELPQGVLAGRAVSARKRGVFNKPTRGIRAQYFLEEGIDQMVEAIPQEYNVLMQKWLNEGKKGGRAYLSGLKVRGGTARIKNFASASVRVTA